MITQFRLSKWPNAEIHMPYFFVEYPSRRSLNPLGCLVSIWSCFNDMLFMEKEFRLLQLLLNKKLGMPETQFSDKKDQSS